MAGLIGLDFETYGGVSLPDHGLHRYWMDKTFQPLIASFKWREGTALVCQRYDLTEMTRAEARRQITDVIGTYDIVAHNASFEDSVLTWLGCDYPASRFVDSAVVARVAGASGHLEGAAPQLLDVDKMAAGKHLMRLFSIPGEYQEKNGDLFFDRKVVDDHPAQWAEYGDYCDLDAELGLRIVEWYLPYLGPNEREYMAVTMEMNRRGWPIDIPLVQEMNRRYIENLETLLADFRMECDAWDLNLNSLQQMKQWCEERGVKATSFDEQHVARYLKLLEKKLKDPGLNRGKTQNYAEVVQLLRTKQALGGSSLKKLKVMLDTAVEDPFAAVGQVQHRAKDQYLHCGAGQTLRTTGRSIQMQNLTQMGEEPGVMDELFDNGDEPVEWDNSKLAENIRQVFCASDPGGALIIGDFSSVESRGLAYCAGETWKLNAYKQRKKIYEALAAQMFNKPYESIEKSSPERKAGKVGELSCGYGAGAEAVKGFAAKMGIEMSEAEAARLVYDWRDACPDTVRLWEQLDSMLHKAVEEQRHSDSLMLGMTGMKLTIQRIGTPVSLRKQVSDRVQSLEMRLQDAAGHVRMKRYFHGCYASGRNIRYYKPSDRKTGDLWRANYVDPKTKQVRFYELYGGKLAGILVQSFCRELFMQSLLNVKKWCDLTKGQVQLIGQFHDEIVLDWKPGALSLEFCKSQLEGYMSDPGWAAQFPLEADIKHDYRYTK